MIWVISNSNEEYMCVDTRRKKYVFKSIEKMNAAYDLAIYGDNDILNCLNNLRATPNQKELFAVKIMFGSRFPEELL
jgi:hypothetical protein